MTRKAQARAQTIERATQRAMLLAVSGLGLTAILLLLARFRGLEALSLISP